MASRLRPLCRAVSNTHPRLQKSSSLSSTTTTLTTFPKYPSPRLYTTSPVLYKTAQVPDFDLPASTKLPTGTRGPSKPIPELDLTGKTILVTGAAQGLGLCMAQALLESGAKVYALDRKPESDRSSVFAEIQERAKSEWGTELHYRQIDTVDVPALNRTVEEIADEAGRMDGLIAAAGIQQETPALEYTREDANRMFEVNITGTFMTAQAVTRQYLRLRAASPTTHPTLSIALIASMSGTVANRGLLCPAYNASKAGVLQLGRNLAAEWGQHNVRVNTISPGYIVTAMVEALFETHPERRAQWGGQNMLGRVSAPEEYRSLGVFLMGDGSAFMTGSDLRCDGGHSAW